MSDESSVISNNAEDKEEDCPPSPDIHFEPVIKLPLIEVKTLEEDEEELIKLRAKLYRFDNTEPPGEWKERGTGEVKLLKNKLKQHVRVLMRRDKTLKICANHLVQSFMELLPNAGNEKAWMWSTRADYADAEPKPELLAIKFANVENAQRFKTVFDDAKKYVLDITKEQKDEVVEKLEDLTLTDESSSSEKEVDVNGCAENQSPKATDTAAESKTES